MEPIPCVNCATFFIPRNRKQNYCTEAECQRARKAAWQRFKLKYDDEYRSQQHLSHQKWLQSNPGYYRSYRRRNPDKVKRNRALQAIRNRRNRHRAGRQKSADPTLIAKMDARKFCHFNMVGQFYLVPVIAKMDVSRVNIYTIFYKILSYAAEVVTLAVTFTRCLIKTYNLILHPLVHSVRNVLNLV